MIHGLYVMVDCLSSILKGNIVICQSTDKSNNEQKRKEMISTGFLAPFFKKSENTVKICYFNFLNFKKQGDI